MRLKVLAVDDDRIILELFKSIVGSLGYEVVTLSDSREATQRIMTEKFDLIAVDVLMPDLDGFELAQRIRASPSNHAVPILMFTASDNIETMRRGFAAGVTLFVGKPLSAAKLRGLFGAARGLMLQEHRRYVRLPLRVDVNCQSGTGRHFNAYSLDLSRGGMLLQPSGGLADGEVVEVEFALPTAREPLKIMAKVARKASPECMALEFIDPDPAHRAALECYIASQTQGGRS
jgi:CheY-like chemotaxis protein